MSLQNRLVWLSTFVILDVQDPARHFLYVIVSNGTHRSESLLQSLPNFGFRLGAFRLVLPQSGTFVLNGVPNRLLGSCSIFTAILGCHARQKLTKIWLAGIPNDLLSLLSKLSQLDFSELV